MMIENMILGKNRCLILFMMNRIPPFNAIMQIYVMLIKIFIHVQPLDFIFYAGFKVIVNNVY